MAVELFEFHIVLLRTCKIFRSLVTVKVGHVYGRITELDLNITSYCFKELLIIISLI